MVDKVTVQLQSYKRPRLACPSPPWPTVMLRGLLQQPVMFLSIQMLFLFSAKPRQLDA